MAVGSPTGIWLISGGSVTSNSETTSAPPRLHFSVAPEPSRLLRARERVRDYLTQHCADETVVNDVVLAIEEACANAIRHSECDKDIEIRLRLSGHTLHAVVKDRGRGFDVAAFDPQRVPDPTLDHGRGLFLISRLCDELRLKSAGGLTVEMAKTAVDTCDPSADGASTPTATARQSAYWRRRQQSLFEDMAESFAMLDWEYRITYGNVSALEFFGLPASEVVGRSFWDVFAATRTMPVGEAVRRAMELGVSGIEEYVSPRLGRWVETRVYPTGSGVSLYLRDIDERKRKELERDELLDRLSANKAMLERLADVLETAPQAVAVRSPDGPITLCNQAYADLTGYSREELAEVVRSWDDLTPPRWREPTARALAEAKMRRRSVRYEKEYVRKDGSLVPIEAFVLPVFGADGTLVEYRGFVTDITERKSAEQALEESERRHRFGLQHAPAAIYEIDFRPPGPRFVSVNDYMCAYSGYSREELLSMSPFAFLDEEGQTRFRARIAASLAGEPPAAEVEYRFRTKTGEERIAALQVAPVFEDGKPVRGFVVAHDVTERKRAQQALEFQAQLLAQAQDAITATDEQLLVTYWNEAAQALFGWSATEVLGRPSTAVFRNAAPGSPPEAAIEQMLTGDGYDGEAAYTRKDGSSVLTQAHVRVLRDEAGDFAGTIASFRDISENRRLRDLLDLATSGRREPDQPPGQGERSRDRDEA